MTTIKMSKRQPDGTYKEIDMNDPVVLLEFFKDLADHSFEKTGYYCDLPEKQGMLQKVKEYYPTTWKDIIKKYPRWWPDGGEA